MSWCGPQPAGDNQLMEDVQPFKFGQSEPQAPVVLSGMDRIGERMARRIRAVLEPMTGMKPRVTGEADRKSTRLNSQSLMRHSYAVFCLKKKKKTHLIR